MKRWQLGCLVVVFLLCVVWVVFNPPGRFGIYRFGLTVYSGIPFPVVDVVVHANGLPGIRGSKAHIISVEEFDQLIRSEADARPEVVVIGTGYEGLVQADPRILIRGASLSIEVEVLPTPQAIKRYNELQKAGKKVVAIIHSIC